MWCNFLCWINQVSGRAALAAMVRKNRRMQSALNDAVAGKRDLTWLWVFLTVLVLGGVLSSCHGASVVDERFLDGVALIESGGRANAVGDGGRARGAYQFWAAAWKEADAIMVLHSPYSMATEPLVARRHAAAYFSILESRLAKALRRNPTRAECYASYNVGYTRFLRLGFQLNRCPAATQRACVRLEKFCGVCAARGAAIGSEPPTVGQLRHDLLRPCPVFLSVRFRQTNKPPARGRGCGPKGVYSPPA